MTLGPLDYAPRPSLLRRRIARRIAVGASLLVALVIGWNFAPGAWRHLQILQLQRKCLAYRAPAGQEIIRSSGNPATNASVPGVWRDFYDAIVAPGVARFGSGPTSGGTLFIHERISPSGRNRLVAVEVNPSGDVWVNITGHVIQPGTLFSKPALVAPPSTFNSLAIFDRSVRYFPGQPDPKDHSHFTIRLIRGSGSEIIVDGWLTDDDVVRLNQRAPP